MFEVLPRCVLGYLADFCPPSDLFALSATCRHLRPLSQRPEVSQWLEQQRNSAPVAHVWNFVTSNGRFRNKQERNAQIANTRVFLDRDNQGRLTGAHVKYHDSQVATLTAGDELIFDTHGFRTQSTFRVMEMLCSMLEIPLHFNRKNWLWFMTRTGDPSCFGAAIHCFGGSEDDIGQGQRETPADTSDYDRFVYSLTNPPQHQFLAAQRFKKRLKRE